MEPHPSARLADLLSAGKTVSSRKIKLTFDELLLEGISHTALNQVHAPLGFDISPQAVPEIAISITAELIAHRNLGHLPNPARPPRRP